MTTGTRKLLLTIDLGGVPPHIRPLLQSVVSATEEGLWGEARFSTTTFEQIEEEALEVALQAEALEATLQEVKGRGDTVVQDIKAFCESPEVAATLLMFSTVRSVLNDVGSQVDLDAVMDKELPRVDELLNQLDEVQAELATKLRGLDCFAQGMKRVFFD